MRSWVVALVVLTGSLQARAADCGDPEEVEARIRFLNQELNAEGSRWNQWTLGWGLALGAGSVGQLGAAFAFNGPPRHNFVAAGISIGAGSIISWTNGLRTQAPIRRLSSIVDGSDRCAVLAESERTLMLTLSYEVQSRSWLGQVINAALSVATGLVLWLVYHDPLSGGLIGGIGLGIGEANIFTQPNHLQDVKRDYDAGKFRPGAATRVQWQLAPQFGLNSAGFSFRITM